MKGAVQGVQRSIEGQGNERLEPAQIDLRKMADILLPKAWLILLVAVLGGLAAFLYTHFMITPLYTANVTLYVRSTQARLDGSDSVNYNELVIAQHITDTYITVLQSDAILEKVAEESPVEGDNAAVIRSMMDVSAVEDTSIINVRITSASPKRAEQMANLIAEHAPGPMAEYIEGSSVRILNYAKVPVAPSSPNVRQNVTVGFLIGLLLCAAGVWMHADLMCASRAKRISACSAISRYLAQCPALMGPVPSAANGKAGKNEIRQQEGKTPCGFARA